MATKFLVVEVLDPVVGLTNVYIAEPEASTPTDEWLASVSNGFLRLKEDGVIPTGAFSRVTRTVDGQIFRREVVKEPAFVNGWRTRSAFLR